ncbi:A-kinase-interacting protein 1 [Epinephelus fuscoguttatus]|uniref:A-kinase-interacting protein 1 n=1 Tax=Epinephelus lanceolatus TaxID=310571 RepID=UPI001445B66B|nr:A-kinase-interacting protein 1 [Epinephelus lanceolatus]XP_049430808.1 A-kinase-interacting protein 1 [Epinephelus fuscoguttatus]XP_049430809.1 A-kinase-interacting protein 1 [Epinephelus fuscoguttatus]
MMASQAWLESSLRRSASLGREVLERASRRSVDWTSTGPSQTSTTTDEDTQIPVKRTHSELDDVFGTIAELMAQTTQQCKRFYESGRCSEPSHAERNHVTRFHSRPAVRTTTAAQSHRKHVKAPHSKGRVSSSGEDFFIEVSPGTYAVTASMPELNQQTQLVSVRAGESVSLTFDL